MNNSRSREFDIIRHQKLSYNSSQLSKSSVNLQLKSSHLYKNSLPTSFLKKNRPDVCINCTNRHTVSEKRERMLHERTEQAKRVKQQLQMMALMKDPVIEDRLKKKKEALQYNKKLLSKRFNESEFQKKMDMKYIDHMVNQQKQRIKQENEMNNKRIAQNKRYAKQLQMQLNDKKNKKILQQRELLTIQNNSLPLFYNDKSQHLKQYSQQLKKQIADQQTQKEHERIIDVLETKRTLEIAQKQFEKYYDLVKRQSEVNPEIFSELKQKEESKKISKVKERQQKQSQRKKEAQRELQALREQMEREIDHRKRYIQQLQQQMGQKRKRQLKLKEKQKQFKIKVEKYSEDVLRQTRKVKPCNQCHVNYDDKCFA